jgi:hypothetical protein
MIDPRNMCILTGGLTRDPEMNDNRTIVKMGLGVDYAGNDSVDKARNSGYFDMKVFIGEATEKRNPDLVKFVKGQLDDGKMKKGSRLQVVGRMVQERWEKDGSKMSRVVIYPEAISYAPSSGGNGTKPAGEGTSNGGADSSTDPDDLAPPPDRF